MKKIIVLILLVPMINYGQFTYFTDFDALNVSPGEGQWDGTGWDGTSTNSCSVNSMKDNCYGTGSSQVVEMSNTVSLGVALGNVTAVSFDYKILEYSSVTATPETDFKELKVYYSTSGTVGTWSLIYTLNTHVSSIECATKSFSFTPSIGNTFLQFTVEHSGISNPDFSVYIDNLSIIETLCNGTVPSATVSTTNLSCITNTYDIDVVDLNNGSFVSTDVYVDGVLDVLGSQLLGKTVGSTHIVTLTPIGGSVDCNVEYSDITAICVTPCLGNPTPITSGYTESNIIAPGVGAGDDWVTEAESCGTASSGEFEDSDVKLYSYTTGAIEGESIYFTIEYDYTADESHSIGVWENCIADSLIDCVTSYYNFDNIAGVCLQGMLANTTYYIGVTNNYFSSESLNFDIIDFTVETSATVPDDECEFASIMNIDEFYVGSTRCSYTASVSSPGGCGAIENDSWIEFVAGETKVVIDYSVSNCSNGNGIQLSAFSGSCGSLSLISGSCINYVSNNSSGTWVFSGLTIGESYYIRADGYANDLCSYSYDPISGILPIGLSSFDAVALSNEYNRINWETSSEINTDFFEVEKSGDGLNYSTVSRHSAAGNSNQKLDYFTYDKATELLTYYRLKQYDLNGEYTYSNVIKLENKKISDGISIYPNPTSDGLVCIKSLNEMNRVEVLDNSGRIVSSEYLEGSNEIILNLDGLDKGGYFLQIVNDYSIILKKIIIK